MRMNHPLMSYQFRFVDDELAILVQDVEYNLVTKRIKMNTRATVSSDSFEAALYFIQKTELRVEALFNGDTAYTIVFSGIRPLNHSLKLSYYADGPAVNNFEWSFTAAWLKK